MHKVLQDAKIGCCWEGVFRADSFILEVLLKQVATHLLQAVWRGLRLLIRRVLGLSLAL